MPLAPDDYSQRCSYCNINVGKANLKKCGACRMVHYCSKACQKGAWKTHKPRCANGSKMREQMVENETFAMITKVLDGWLKYWRNSFHTYGLISMDLANHPDGRLATHCMVINLEFREDPPSRAQTLRMTKGQVMSRNEFANTMREMKCPEESVQQWLRETRGDDTGLICLILEGTFRFLWFSVRNLTKYKNMDREFSKKAYATWAEDLAMQIEQGWRAGSENTAADLE